MFGAEAALLKSTFTKDFYVSGTLWKTIVSTELSAASANASHRSTAARELQTSLSPTSSEMDGHKIHLRLQADESHCTLPPPDFGVKGCGC